MAGTTTPILTSEDLLKETLNFLEHAPFDLSNGVEHQGVDEGEAIGWRAVGELTNKIRVHLGIPTQNEEIKRWVEENPLPF